MKLKGLKGETLSASPQAHSDYALSFKNRMRKIHAVLLARPVGII
jgi:hypothetical protein